MALTRCESQEEAMTQPGAPCWIGVLCAESKRSNQFAAIGRLDLSVRRRGAVASLRLRRHASR
jgi:hypothetical protein